MCNGSEAGSYLRLIDSCITQLGAQGPSRTCNESKEEEEGAAARRGGAPDAGAGGGDPTRGNGGVVALTPAPGSPLYGGV